MTDLNPPPTRRRLALAGLLVASFALAVTPFATATHVTPTFVEGPTNHTCSEFAPEGATWLELKADPPEDDTTYMSDDGLLNVTITIDEDLKVFSWTADKAWVHAVFVKAGSKGHNLYEYDPPSDGDTGLTSPGTGNAISHISFCYVVEEEPTCEDQPDMPECQPTCEDQPDMPECQPTCEDQPDMPECQPTCDDQPDMPECQPTCEEQPDMPECQPTCEEQPDMEECTPTCEEVPEACEPTCEDQPDMPECQPTCDDQPDMPECQPTCDDQPEMPECQEDVCVGIVMIGATANGDGSNTVMVQATTEFDLYRAEDGMEAVLLGHFDGDTEFVDLDVSRGATVTYQAVVDGEVCAAVEVTTIPDFPTTIGLVAGGSLGLLGYALMRRKK